MRRTGRGGTGNRRGGAAAAGGRSTAATPALLAFAPLRRLAFGVAVGTAAALLVFAVTAARLLMDPAGQTDLSYLAQFFPGYRQTWTGALVGAGWGFAVGFGAGWICAAVRNLVIATWLFFVRSRAELDATHDLLDDI
jgi:hypothetical protein